MKSEEEIRRTVALFSALGNSETTTMAVRVLLWVIDEWPPPVPEMKLLHGVNCPKAPHVMRGLHHLETEDGTFVHENAVYCGRCHVQLAKATATENLT